MKTAFITRDITKAFDHPTRQFHYWAEQQFILPDINPTQPKIYSIGEAIVYGLTAYFINKGGYYPVQAARIARLGYNAALILSSYSPEKDCELIIFEGETGYMAAEDQNGNTHLYYFFIKPNSSEDYKAEMKNIQNWNVKHIYKIYKIIDDVMEKLGCDPTLEDRRLNPTKDIKIFDDWKPGEAIRLEIENSLLK